MHRPDMKPGSSSPWPGTGRFWESGPDTGEWPDARDRITRIRGGKLTVSDGYGRLSRELEAITADYEAGPDAYAENKAASDEMLREACRVEWIG